MSTPASSSIALFGHFVLTRDSFEENAQALVTITVKECRQQSRIRGVVREVSTSTHHSLRRPTDSDDQARGTQQTCAAQEAMRRDTISFVTHARFPAK